MNKTKTLSILVGILALINIGLLIFLMIGRPKGHRPNDFRTKNMADQFIKEEFGFDDSQMDLFLISKESHFTSARKLKSELDELSRSFYLIDLPDTGNVRDSLLNGINEVSNQIYLNNLTHFEDVRGICKPDQLPKMESFINVLISPNRRKGPRKRKRKNRH